MCIGFWSILRGDVFEAMPLKLFEVKMFLFTKPLAARGQIWYMSLVQSQIEPVVTLTEPLSGIRDRFSP